MTWSPASITVSPRGIVTSLFRRIAANVSDSKRSASCTVWFATGLSSAISNSAIRTAPSANVSTSCAPGRPAIRTMVSAVSRSTLTMKSTPNAPGEFSQVRSSDVFFTRETVNASETVFAVEQETMFVSSSSVLAMRISASSTRASRRVSSDVPSPSMARTSRSYVSDSTRSPSMSTTTTSCASARLPAILDPTSPAPTTITRTSRSTQSFVRS